MSGEVRKAIERFAARPWFYRTWVTQEFALSKTAIVMCGDDAAKWTEFSSWAPAVTDPTIAVNHDDPPIDGRNRLRTLAYLKRNRDTEAILKYNVICQATDPKEKVYGILGLFNRQFINVDYTLPFLRFIPLSRRLC